MIVAVKPGALTSKEKEKLTKQGHVVVTMDDPDSMRIYEPDLPIDVKDFTLAALRVISKDWAVSQAFLYELCERLAAKEMKKEEA